MLQQYILLCNDEYFSAINFAGRAKHKESAFNRRIAARASIALNRIAHKDSRDGMFLLTRSKNESLHETNIQPVSRTRLPKTRIRESLIEYQQFGF